MENKQKELALIGYKSKILQSDGRIIFHGAMFCTTTLVFIGTAGLLICLPEWPMLIVEELRKLECAWKDRKFYKKVYKIIKQN